MYLFDKRFVHFMWDDALEGKKCFLSDSIDVLKIGVEQMWSRMCFKVIKGEDSYPFGMYRTDGGRVSYRFAYYDPNYWVKKAFKEGKGIQFQSADGEWNSIVGEDMLKWYIEEGCKLQIMPEEKEKYIVYRRGDVISLTLCRERDWETAKKLLGAKTKLYVGTEAECLEWIESHRKFERVIKSWEDGKIIQVTPKGTDKWMDLDFNPSWDLRDDYRVKPECSCVNGVDSEACVGCEQSDDGKPHPFENYHCYGCDKSSKKGYRPYETVHEFIQDYQDRFPTTNPRPCYTLPFIWLRNKNKKDERELVYCFRDLVIKMDNTYWDMNDLFNQWEYLDGSPCGMEVKE